nr:reverse transcriptase domain-containing protein [Tanacetum cinerariifolium]
MDDEPMWAADRVVALTPDSAITIPETVNKFAIKGNHLTLIKGNQFDGRTKIDPHKLVDKQSGRPSRSVPSNTQPNLKGSSSKPYQLLQAQNEHVNAVFTRSVILEMEEDIKVPLILGRPFLHTADAVIRVKQKQLNLGVGTKRMIFHIDFAMKHSYSNDDTCFSIDVIDEILEEDFDALPDEGSEILHSIEGTILKEKLFAEFDEFMAMTADEKPKSESDTEEPPFEKITLTPITKLKHILKNLIRILKSNLFLITWNMYS